MHVAALYFIKYLSAGPLMEATLPMVDMHFHRASYPLFLS